MWGNGAAHRQRVCTSSAQPQTTHTAHTHTHTHTRARAHTHTHTHAHTPPCTMSNMVDERAHACTHWRTHSERNTHKHAHTITHHVAHSNPGTASKLLYQRMIVCGEECSALDALSELTHNSTGYGSPVICSCTSACPEKAVGETDQVNQQSQSVSGHHNTYDISLPPAFLSFNNHSIIHTYICMYNYSLLPLYDEMWLTRKILRYDSTKEQICV